tara:strand:- start:107 stop:838 length:732 start_codon:yes stop_codon:yes gene_type:complete
MREILDIFCKKFKPLKTLFIFSLITFLCFIKPSYSKDFNYYDDLVKDWIKIFPDQNRNAAGPKFFKHILDKEITYQDFIEYNKLYCAVSGSLISPNSRPDFVYLKSTENGEKICGFYHKCCFPCSCDLMKYSQVKNMKYKFSDGEKEFTVLTIKNPCGKKDFPREVNRDYFCNGKVLDNNQVISIDNRLVIGLLHNSSKCNEQSIAVIDKDEYTGAYCKLRNNAPLEQVQGGMGDIFIKMARD